MNIVLKSNFQFNSGYGNILETLLDNGSLFNLQIAPIAIGTINKRFHEYFYTPCHTDDRTELIIAAPPEDHNLHPIYRLINHPNRIFFTMWEATKINYSFIDILNQCSAVIVPNQWNADNFRASGLKTDIHVLNLYSDATFQYSPSSTSSPFVFGTANADPRKRIKDVIRVFHRTFGCDPNVRLSVKVTKDERSQINGIINPNIDVIVEDFSRAQLLEWYKSINAFVSCVSAEGWGLMQHEAMSVGRPLLAPSYGGINEYLTEEVGYPIKYTEVDAESYWKSPGSKWSMYDKSHLIETMRHCVDHPDEVIRKGKSASDKMTKLNVSKFMSELSTVIHQYCP
jgi:glycosyltransferase involved in cell wall biosynthesis